MVAHSTLLSFPRNNHSNILHLHPFMMFKISDLTFQVALTLTSFFVSASAKKSNANVNGPFDGIATVFDVPDNYT